MSDDNSNENINTDPQASSNNKPGDVFEPWGDSHKNEKPLDSSSSSEGDNNANNLNHSKEGSYIPTPNYEQRSTEDTTSSQPFREYENTNYSPNDSYNSQNNANSQFHPQQYPNYAGNPYSPSAVEGNQHATHALIFGILSLFFAGIIFGPLAIWKSSNAEKLGVSATPGKVLGWIGVAFSILWFFWFSLIILGSFAGLSGAEYMEPMIYDNGFIES